MGEDKLRETVVVSNPQGLHARPADMFVKLASRFESMVKVVKGNERVDGKSILAILTLGAERGTEIAIEATGPDATDALQALVDLVKDGFVEDQEDKLVDQQ